MLLLKDMLGKFLGRDGTHTDRSAIIRGTVQSVLIQGASIALVLAGNLLMARWAGPDAYGKYVHVFNWISILSIMALGGKEDIAVSRIPRYASDGQSGRIFAFVWRSNSFIILSSLAIAALFLGLIYIFPLKTLHDNRQEFLLAAGAIYFMTFITLNQNILQALHLIKLSQWVEKLIKPCLLFIFFLLSYRLLHRSDSSALIILTVLVTGICTIILARIVWTKIKAFKNDERAYTPEKLGGKMAYFFSIDLLNLLGTKVTMLILPYFSLQKEIGIFNISYRFADLVIFPFFLVNAVVPQLFARHYGSDAAHKQSLYAQSSKLMTLLAIPLLLMNIFAGKVFLGWFGADFLQGYGALVQLSVAQLLFSFFGPAHTILTMLDKEKYATIALLIYVVVLFTGNILLVPVLGVTGGTVSVIIGSLVYNSILAALAYRYYGVLSPFLAFMSRPFRRSV